MSKYCTQCGTQNIDEAKFCKSCGYSLNHQDTPTGEVSNTTTHIQEFKYQENFSHTKPTGSSEHEQSISDEAIAWSPWLLLLPIIVWVIFYLGLEAHANVPVMIGMIFSASLAEALGGAIGIMGLALIPTVIIWINKKINSKPYPNFVMHTIIGSVLTLTLGIYSHARSFNNEQQAITASAEVAVPTPAADYYVAPAAYVTEDPAAPAAANYISPFNKAEHDCNNGQASGCSDLGNMYDLGHVVTQDHNKARIFLQKGCDLGSAEGCWNLALMYKTGTGVTQDYNKAKILFQKGCGYGFAAACRDLGELYEYGGVGVAQDYAASVKLYKKACSLGDSGACDKANAY